MTARSCIAHFAGPNATILNGPLLVTSNKARRKYGLPVVTNPDGTPARVDVLRPQRLAAPATVLVERFSAHPLERDAAELYGPPDGYLDAQGCFHKERQSPADKAVYEIELRPEDGPYPLPYMARQADLRAWDEECAEPGAPAHRARQVFHPDGARIFEEIDRLGISDKGWGNLISSRVDVDFYRALPPAGYTKGFAAIEGPTSAKVTSLRKCGGDISFHTSPITSTRMRRGEASRTSPMSCSVCWRAANTTVRSGPKGAHASRRQFIG